jgi:hypothetical protein
VSAFYSGSSIAITTSKNHSEDLLIRLVEDTDIPVYYYACPNTLQGDCSNRNCKWCTLSLKGYLNFTGGKRIFTQLPEAPFARIGWKCTEHSEEICEECGVFEEGPIRFRVWEWDLKSRSFVNRWVDIAEPLKHGFYNRSLEKKEARERRERAIKREAKRKPYDSANSRARKTLVKINA